MALRFCSDDPGPALVAETAHAALLVVGTGETVGWGRLVSGSVSHCCLSHARCPVAAVPVVPRGAAETTSDRSEPVPMITEPRGDRPGSAVRETHCAWVFLVGDRAVKLKKPLDFGFVDWRDAADRRRACEREVALNRRFAPDVYQGVASIAMAGAVCESLVIMRRMPDSRRLSTLLAQGFDVAPALRAVARQLAIHHASARRSPRIDAAGSGDALLGRWTDNLDALDRTGSGQLGADQLANIRSLASGYISGRRPLFAERIRSGCVRDGHGDLLADDIFCLDDEPRILDCLEFDDDLRAVDAMDDAAVLAMDLERLGAAEAAEVFLNAFSEFSGISGPVSLIHHYVAYRAVMRAKVAMIKADQGDPAAVEQARLLCSLGLKHLRMGEPTLMLVGGLPGTGKSTLAGALADRTGAVVVAADRVRKELGGVEPDRQQAHGWRAGLYDVETTRRTYTAVLERALRLLQMGESVVVDASFADAAVRASARSVARDGAARLTELRCTCPADLAAARITSRWGSGDLSEATVDVAERMQSTFDPWPEAMAVDTSSSLAAALAWLAPTLSVGPKVANLRPRADAQPSSVYTWPECDGPDVKTEQSSTRTESRRLPEAGGTS